MAEHNVKAEREHGTPRIYQRKCRWNIEHGRPVAQRWRQVKNMVCLVLIPPREGSMPDRPTSQAKLHPSCQRMEFTMLPIKCRHKTTPYTPQSLLSNPSSPSLPLYHCSHPPPKTTILSTPPVTCPHQPKSHPNLKPSPSAKVPGTYAQIISVRVAQTKPSIAFVFSALRLLIVLGVGVGEARIPMKDEDFLRMSGCVFRCGVAVMWCNVGGLKGGRKEVDWGVVGWEGWVWR